MTVIGTGQRYAARIDEDRVDGAIPGDDQVHVAGRIVGGIRAPQQRPRLKAATEPPIRANCAAATDGNARTIPVSAIAAAGRRVSGGVAVLMSCELHLY